MTKKRKSSSPASKNVTPPKKFLQAGKTATESHGVVIVNENKNSYASIAHKNCYGANNWKKFIESVPKPIGSSTQKTPLNISLKPKKVVNSNLRSKLKNSLDQSEKQRKYNYTSSVDKNESKNISSRPKENFTSCDTKVVEKKGKALTKQIAIDCEMVGVEMGINGNMVGRVSIVNALGDCIYDKFVKPTELVLDFRTHVSGIRPNNLKNAPEFDTVQKEVADILKGRILIGHAVKNDLAVLLLSHPKRDIRDTSKFKKFREGHTLSLKKLAKKYLGVTIQDGEHSSVQDALAAMQLYRMFRKEWEASLRSKKKITIEKHNQ